MNTLEGTSIEQPPACTHCVFGLIVTGKGERDFLSSLFRQLMERAGCSFRVIGFIGQRSPITSPTRQLHMVGTGKIIPDKDAQQIGLPARSFLIRSPCHFVILLDDVEHARRPVVSLVFQRYRLALDTILPPAARPKAAVHFFANMLEAYYFAHSAAVNQALGTTVLQADHNGDVELIGHPKNEIKQLFSGFDERDHGALIVPTLELDHILDNPNTCAYLRSLMCWCVRQLRANCPVWDPNLEQCFQLQAGVREQLTDNQ
jgi:hypothetical protein